MRRNLKITILAALSLLLTQAAVTADADAQTRVGGSIDINAFRPAIDSRGYITVNASQVLGHKELSFGLVTNWGHSVLTLEGGGDSYEVENIISPTLVAAYGLKFGPAELELGMSLPFHVMSGDRAPDFDGGTPADPNDDLNFGFDGQGIGDVGVHLKTRFLSTSKGPKLGLGVIASLYLPTASEEERWLGEEKLTPQIMGILDKEFGDDRLLRLAVNGGIRLRGGTTFTDNQTGVMADPNTPATGQTVEAKATIPFGVALAYALVPQKFDIVAETFGAIPLGGENWFPAEAIGGVKLYLARNSFLSIGGGVGFMPDKGGNPDVRGFMGIVFEPNIGDRDGDGLKDDVDQCPDDPEDFDDFEDEDGCPEPDNDRDGILDVDDECPNDPEDKDGFEDEDGCPEGNEFDRDGDGILDKDDECPDDPEDKDGFEDEDGCPDIDNDQDGILDVDDLCPDDPEDADGFEDKDGCPDPDNDSDRILDADDECPRIDGETQEETAETYNGNEDDDGCPDRGRVVVTDTKIEILDKIYFEYNKATIKSQSFPILDAIVATLEGNPDIALIEIQGHTDERGSDSYNLDLSDRRAASVRTYLTDRGISGDRIQSQGYGETQPLEARSNEAAWAKNRRVEFLILKRLGEN
jgi:outer membrane protein OmpA-like peptidoglycan-associated protein